jgi:hypothetical protein
MSFFLTPGVLVGSRVFLALRWMMSGTFLEDIASRHRLYLAANPSHVGVDVDGVACPLHRPMTCSRQTGEQGFLSCVVLSHRYSLWWRLSRGCEAFVLGYLVEY